MAKLGNAPNRLLVGLGCDQDFFSWGLQRGTEFCGIGENLLLVGEQAIDLSHCVLWHEERSRTRPNMGKIQHNLRLLKHHVVLRAPVEGLGRLLHGHPSETKLLLHQVDVACVFLFQALRQGDGQSLLGACSRLIGLGPGLTPSGDDFLSGIMLALHWGKQAMAFEVDVCQQVDWQAVIDASKERTNLISHTQMFYASQGQANEVLTKLLSSLFGSANEETVQNDIEKVLAIGSTSGSDILAGIGKGLEFLLTGEIEGIHDEGVCVNC
ncbi:MAG: DUF2877 domain-containing protein [Negativicutes bacterium]